MLNWRKPIINAFFTASGYPVFKYLKILKALEHKSADDLQKLQNQKLEELLLHAQQNVPYYKTVLEEANVVTGKQVKLENFCNIPILTKNIIRQEAGNLYSKDHGMRHSYLNTSGGSTGEPIKFMQDKEYKAWSFASRFLFNSWGQKDIGEPELLLWGSQQDTIAGADQPSTRLKRWGFNMLVLNSFLMTDDTMKNFLEQWNAFRPKQVWAYASSIFEFAGYIRRKNAIIFSPRSIICAAETLSKEVRNSVEEVFDCPALNQYGAREAGAIACECPKKEGLHSFVLNNKIEILDDQMKPCEPGATGSVYVTTLNNHSMPFIRYRIGDMATAAKQICCSCGRGWPLIAHVVGRHIEAFKTRDGRVVPGQFFIHFVGVVHNEGFIKRFQVVQKDYDKILVRVVVADEAKFSSQKQNITESFKKVLGQDCKVDFEYVDDIPPTKSGKYLYTISEVNT